MAEVKVKFYKGPWHGKVRMIDSSQLHNGRLEVSVMNKLDRAWFRNVNDPAHAMPSFRTHIYEIKMMGINLGGYGDKTNRYLAPAMHPDGSLFLEYVK